MCTFDRAGERECERSALVNEEIVYFIFQLELDAQLQRALNYEAYEAAQQIRAKRETVSSGQTCAASLFDWQSIRCGVGQAAVPELREQQVQLYYTIRCIFLLFTC